MMLEKDPKGSSGSGCMIVLAIIIAAIMLICGVIIYRAAAQESEPEPPTSAEDVQFTMVSGEDVWILRAGNEQWEKVPFQVLGMEDLLQAPKHVYYSWAGLDADWYIPVEEGSSRCIHIRVPDSALQGVFVYTMRACIRAIEPDGSVGVASFPSPISLYVMRLPRIGQSFFGG